MMASAGDMDTGSVLLAEKVTALSDPAAYPEFTAAVTAVETHFSWVFLTDGFAYKLKKPLRTEDMDFTSLAGRTRNCEREVYLNRRLAPDVYLGVVDLMATEDGRLRLFGSGRVVDRLVRMRRLAEDDCLEIRLKRGLVASEDVARLARGLAGFLTSQPPLGPVSPVGLRHEINTSLLDLAVACDGCFEQAVRRVTARLLAFLEYRSDMPGRDRLVDGHGDLRPEHVFLGPPLRIIDCLEFSDALRRRDPVDELAALGMECERLGGAWIGPVLLEAYGKAAGVFPPAGLCAFYRGLRALVRARIAVRHLMEEPIRAPERWPRQAAEYLRLADRAAAELTVPSGRRPSSSAAL
ncbi:hypothetical protein [Inquilinus sp. OTU3971]|uniref:hypothetical protein n=1 Tax=Inquilinus sp. OTU3971 TaxID=3043855 RepID=UPI00313EB3BD